MNTEQLEKKLLALGFNRFWIGGRGDDEFCLFKDKTSQKWFVAYCERGSEREVFFETDSETAACEFYLDFISSKIRHDHIVAQFREERHAIILKNWLRALGLKNHISTETFAAAPLYKVWVYDHNIFIARHYFPILPLTQLPETLDLLRLALARAHEFDYTAFALRSPVSDIESQVWVALEHQTGIVIPKEYAQFLLEVANGGRWNSALTFMGYEEVLQHNNKETCQEPLPDFLEKLIADQAHALENLSVERPASEPSDYAGLLRISHWSYNTGALYITSNNAMLYMETIEHEHRFSVVHFSNQTWLPSLLHEVLEHLEPYERTLALLRTGTNLHQLEQTFPITASLEWKHAFIASIIGVAPVQLESKIILWQVAHDIP
jgi:hypothetical protein